jgi:hypothetical protein
VERLKSSLDVAVDKSKKKKETPAEVTLEINLTIV